MKAKQKLSTEWYQYHSPDGKKPLNKLKNNVTNKINTSAL
jgi:hypothetical protein